MSKPAWTIEVSIDLNDGSAQPTRMITVTPDGDGPLTGVNIYKDAAIRAAKTAAASQVDYASFSSDSAYLEELDRRRAEMTVTSVALAGAKTPWILVGCYEDYPEGGTWCDTVEAVSPIDARQQGAWQMAINCRADDDAPNGTQEDLELFFDEIAAQDIVYCHTALPADPSRLALIKAEPCSPIRLLPVETVSSDEKVAALLAEAKSLGVGFVAIPA